MTDLRVEYEHLLASSKAIHTLSEALSAALRPVGAALGVTECSDHGLTASAFPDTDEGRKAFHAATTSADALVKAANECITAQGNWAQALDDVVKVFREADAELAQGGE